jgi:SAM-dependent methyltransferase
MADIYGDARLYEALGAQQFGGSDLAYWQRLCARYGGPVLELACGSGRLTIPLADEGVDIEGLDISPAMLALARKKSDACSLNLRWHLGDAADFTVDRKFSFIFLPNNSVAHLLRWLDLVSCLNCVKRHLGGDGRFALDYFNPALALLLRDPAERFPVAAFTHPDTGEEVVVTETSTYDSATQINHIRWFWRFEGRAEEVVSDLPMRVYFPQELDALLSCAGFVIEEKYGGYDMSPFTTTSQKQLIVVRAA